MADVQHASLTGALLHEPKGADTAVANRVYVSDGAGSGAWSTVPSAALSSNTQAFQSQLLHVREEQASGVNGTGGLVLNTWTKIVINTVKTNEISSATLVSSVISLPAGTYFAEGMATTGLTSGSGGLQLRLQDTTSGTTVVTGVGTTCDGTLNNEPKTMHIKGRFTLAGTKNVELQGNINGAGSSPTNAGGFGTEVYSDLLIWKIA